MRNISVNPASAGPRFWAIVAAVALLLLIALFPLRLAFGMTGLSGQGVTARLIEGPVWNGTVQELSFGPANIGDAYARLELLPLLIGKRRFVLDRPGINGFAPFNASFTQGWGSRKIRVSALSLPGGALSGKLPFDEIAVTGLEAEFSGGACREAKGSAQLRLSPGLSALGWADTMQGRIGCDGKQLQIAFVSPGGLETASVHLDATGAYRVRMRASDVDPAIAPMLRQSGFGESADGFLLQERGSF